jgi:hypothetical protein
MVKIVRGNGISGVPAGGADDALAQWRARAGAAVGESNAAMPAVASDTAISRAELERQLGLTAGKSVAPAAAPTLGEKVDGLVGTAEKATGMAMFGSFLGLPLAKGAGWVASQPFKLVGKRDWADNIRTYTGGQVEGRAAVGLGRIPEMTVGDVLGESNTNRISGLMERAAGPVDANPVGRWYNQLREKRYTASAAKATGKMETSIAKLQEASRAVSHDMHGHVSTLESLAGKAAHEITPHMAEEANTAAKAITAAVKSDKGLRALSKHAENVSKHASSAVGRIANKETLGTSLKNASQNFGKAGALHTATNGLMVGMDAFGMYHTAHDFNSDLDKLAELCADEKGLKSKPSLAKVMAMDLPPSLAAVRKEVVAKYGAQLGIRTAGLLGNLRYIMKTGQLNNLFWMAQAGIGALWDKVFEGHGLLPVYSALHDAEKAGQALSANDYASLLVAGCKDCQNHPGDTKNPVIAEIAAYLAEQQVKAADVLKMSDKGEIRALIGRVVAGEKLVQAGAAAAVTVPDAKELAALDKPDSPAAGSFADKIAGASRAAPVEGAGFAAKEKNAPGSFTAKEMQRAAAAANNVNTLG